ncbi:hypothetical protein CTRI78_v005370 [Colletotrichum trifolii]|uniref:DUF7918 domain-containing protein n=1 Tax=Colletotrichum trifolii TaxID=5466 RepID=A0A4R8REU1_COLTR|nr:hypothetical protein CTRI78_v005370 [Colletotrichum trifolii]
MAVLPEIRGLKVSVEVDGRIAAEYADEDGPAQDRSPIKARSHHYSYIESKDDAHFAVTFEIEEGFCPFEALGFYLYVDGQQMDSILWDRQGRRPWGVWRHVVEGFRERDEERGMDRMRKFKFSKITTIDDANNQRVQQDIEASKSMGVILLLVYNVAIRAEGRRDVYRPNQAAPKKPMEVSEKALKGRAVSHGTSYSDGPLVAPTRTVDVHFVDKNPIASFSFKYRSRDALKSELVIPRSPSPDAIDALSEAEIRRLAMERLEHLNGNRRSPTVKRENKPNVIKREHAEFLDLTEEPVKREWKKVKIEGNREAIDLTDD